MGGDRIAVVHVPYDEWNGLQTKLDSLNKAVLKLLNQGQKETLTVKEACEILKCTRNTLNSYVERGLLVPKQVKKQKYSKVLFRREDVEFLIQNG